MQRSALFGLVIALLLCFGALVGCGGVHPAIPNPAAQDAYQAFVKQLRLAGTVVVETDQKPLSEFSGEVHQLIVNGSQVDVFAYATSQDANADAAHLSPMGAPFNVATLFPSVNGPRHRTFIRKTSSSSSM